MSINIKYDIIYLRINIIVLLYLVTLYNHAFVFGNEKGYALNRIITLYCYIITYNINLYIN